MNTSTRTGDKDTNSPPHILVVAAPYYESIVDDLLLGAKRELKRANAQVETIKVSGALEIPPAIAIANRLYEHDGYLALGCVIRGQTYHFEIVAQESARGLMNLGLQGLCIGNGILTVDNERQAEVRARPNKGWNKGGEAARAVLSLVCQSKGVVCPKETF